MSYPIKTRFITEALHAYADSEWKNQEVTEVSGNAFGDVIIAMDNGKSVYYSTRSHALVEIPYWRDRPAMEEFYKKIGRRG